MKFNCGLSKNERLIAIVGRIRNWHAKFAWLPVRVGDNDCRWLEFVEVRYPRACLISKYGQILYSEAEIRCALTWPDKLHLMRRKVEYRPLMEKCDA